MPFALNAYLPSLKKEVQIRELHYRQYRELVKSLYNSDKKETIQQYNSILLDLCPDVKDIDITFEDKLSLLLTVRNYCVSPDLKLKSVAANKDTFVCSITVDTLIKGIRTIDKSRMVELDNIKVSLSSHKVRDEHVFIGNNKDIFIKVASYIDNIALNGTMVYFKDLTIEDRLKIVHSLPYLFFDKIYASILEVEQIHDAQPFLVVTNPMTQETVLTISKNITFDTLQKLIEYIFTEELNNVYRAFYNMVKYAGFTPQYIDSITPIEMQVYWM